MTIDNDNRQSVFEKYLKTIRPHYQLCIALYRYSDNTGINDLTFLGSESMIMEIGFKSGKQGLNDASLGQVFTKTPYGCTVRNLAGGMKTKETGEGVAVEDLKLQCFVGQPIQRLQNQNLEEQNAVKTLGTGIGFSFLFSEG